VYANVQDRSTYAIPLLRMMVLVHRDSDLSMILESNRKVAGFSLSLPSGLGFSLLTERASVGGRIMYNN